MFFGVSDEVPVFLSLHSMRSKNWDVHINGFVGWSPSCPQMAHPEVILLSPTWWIRQTMDKINSWNSKGAKIQDQGKLALW